MSTFVFSTRRLALVVARALVLASLLVVLPKCAGSATLPSGDCGFEIVNTYPHDATAFTQGLIWHDGYLYETTGRYRHSRLRKVHLETGQVVQEHALSDDLFGEGLTMLGDRIYQVTYRSGMAFVYDARTFKELKRFRYLGEGWGLTDDGTRLIASNGTSRLTFLDPDTLQATGSVIVRYADPVSGRDTVVPRLNELEYVGDEILANIWMRDLIARIDPSSGRVTGWIDLSGLKSLGGVDGGEVLNGIAYDARNNRLFVTGKLWPKLFEIKLVPVKSE